MYQPLLSHWQAVKRIIHYLKSNISYGLLFTWHSSMDLAAYSDFDLLGDQDDRQSTSTYCIFPDTNLVSLSSQLTIAHCSTEAEYESLANAAAEVQWL